MNPTYALTRISGLPWWHPAEILAPSLCTFLLLAAMAPKQEERHEMINSLLPLLFLSLGNLSSTSFCTSALCSTSSSVIAFAIICSETDTTLNWLRWEGFEKLYIADKRSLLLAALFLCLSLSSCSSRMRCYPIKKNQCYTQGECFSSSLPIQMCSTLTCPTAIASCSASICPKSTFLLFWLKRPHLFILLARMSSLFPHPLTLSSVIATAISFTSCVFSNGSCSFSYLSTEHYSGVKLFLMPH